jgi:hypothetical protein
MRELTGFALAVPPDLLEALTADLLVVFFLGLSSYSESPSDSSLGLSASSSTSPNKDDF